MAEFKIGEVVYRSGRMIAFDQLFVAKRLMGSLKAALSPDMMVMLVQMLTRKKDDPPIEINPLDLFTAFSTAIGKMPDEDVAYIIQKCCAVTARQQGGLWANLMSPTGVYMFADISGPGYLTIAYNVLSENLGGFFDELRSMLGTQAEPTDQAPKQT